MEPSSIWDGWTRQCYYTMYDQNTDSHCATGWVTGKLGRPAIFKRVADYIREKYNLHGPIKVTDPDYVWNSDMDMDVDVHVIIYANNALRLTPEEFRSIDRLTQVESIAKPLIESANEVMV